MPHMMEQAANSLAQEDGCHVFDVCTAGTTVFLYELYTDKAAFDAHMQTPHYASFTAKTFVFKEPEVEDDVAGGGGAP